MLKVQECSVSFSRLTITVIVHCQIWTRISCVAFDDSPSKTRERGSKAVAASHVYLLNEAVRAVNSHFFPRLGYPLHPSTRRAPKQRKLPGAAKEIAKSGFSAAVTRPTMHRTGAHGQAAASSPRRLRCCSPPAAARARRPSLGHWHVLLLLLLRALHPTPPSW